MKRQGRRGSYSDAVWGRLSWPSLAGKIEGAWGKEYSGLWKLEKARNGFSDFPGDPVVKNSPANAGDMGSIPGLGRFHMPEGNEAHGLQLLSPSSWVCELQLLKPLCLEPMLCNKRSHHNEKSMRHNKEWFLLTETRESPLLAMKTQCSQNKHLFRKPPLFGLPFQWLRSALPLQGAWV